MLAVLPLFHAYGLTVTTLLPLTEGASVVVPERFIPRQILQLIEKHRVSCLIAVPGQYRVLIKDPTPDRHQLVLALHRRSRAPARARRPGIPRALRTIRLVQGYGTTELSPASPSVRHGTTLPARWAGRCPISRSPFAATTMRFFRQGEIGEVCVSGPSVMLGYLGDPQATAQKIRNGVLHTSDKGYLDAEGFLYLVRPRR